MCAEIEQDIAIGGGRGCCERRAPARRCGERGEGDSDESEPLRQALTLLLFFSPLSRSFGELNAHLSLSLDEAVTYTYVREYSCRCKWEPPPKVGGRNPSSASPAAV